MFIAACMTPNPVTIGPDTPVVEAAALLRRHRFRHLPVVDQEERLTGMVTDRDLRSACPSSVLGETEKQRVEEQVRRTLVRAIMSTDFVTLNPESTLDDALLLFGNRNIGALPVVDDAGRVKGIFSLNDMIRAWQRLFGLGERGSVLVAVREEKADDLARLVQLLGEREIPFTRLIRSRREDGAQVIYLRLTTMNLRSVHRLLTRAGLTIQQPSLDG